MLTQTHLPNAFTCPVCGGKLDACGSMHGVHIPKDGDFSVCIYCGEFSVYEWVGGVLQLRVPTVADIKSAKEQPGFWAELLKVQSFCKNRNDGSQ